MYAVIEAGGKQYTTKPGDRIRVEKIEGEIGSPVSLDKVLLIGGNGNLKVGKPYLENARVEAEIVAHGRAKKVIILKKKRRKGYRKKQGHRQYFTTLKINEIIS